MKKMLILFVLWIFALSSAGAATMTTQQTTFPEYRFQSTSTCVSVVGNSAFTSPAVYAPYSALPRTGIRRAEEYSIDGEPDEDDFPTGVLPNPAPVGEPMVLLLMALLYALGHYFARRKHIIYNKQ